MRYAARWLASMGRVIWEVKLQVGRLRLVGREI